MSVAEAARRLGLPERTVRRYAGQVAASDRQVGYDGRPAKAGARYRLAALLSVAEANRRAVAGQVAAVPVQDGGQNLNSGGQVAEGRNPAPNAPAAEEVERLRAQLAAAEARATAAEDTSARLWDALTREQETARAALAELAEERRRAAVMIAATATGKIALDGSSAAPPTAQDGGGNHLSTPATDAHSARNEGAPTSGGGQARGGLLDRLRRALQGR